MNYRNIIAGTAAAVIAASVLGSCGKVDIQPKKDRPSESTTTTMFSFDSIQSGLGSGTTVSSIEPIIADDDDVVGTVKKTTTKKKKTAAETTTTKAITTVVPTTTTTKATTTTTTTTTKATTTTTTTYTISFPTKSSTQSSQPVTKPSSSVETEPPVSSEDPVPTPPPSDNTLSDNAKLSFNGSAAGLGDNFSSVSGALGDPTDGYDQHTNASGATVTEYYYDDMTVAVTDGKISMIEISSGSSATTSGGLRIGMTVGEVEAICGTNYTVEGDIYYVYTEGNVTLTLLVIDGEVANIEIKDRTLYS